jgi:TM2 domain-containing membrane protein YozV
MAESKSKVAAGILAILVGPLGIHKFYMGYNLEGFIYLGCFLGAGVITLITCGLGFPLYGILQVMALVEGIIYLTKTDADFQATYVDAKKAWF